MPQEELGYVELEWTCKNCGSKNPGLNRTCTNCGAAMPEKQQFEVPVQQTVITDEKKEAQAKLGPDIACAYCGTRNTADRAKCVRCGSDLAEGRARQAGETIGALQTETVPDMPCPNCGKPNPATALKCASCGATMAKPKPTPQPAPQPVAKNPFPQWLGVAGVAIAVLLLCVCAGAFFYLSSQTTEATATVQSVEWQRSITIVAQQPVKKTDWEDEIPSDAQKGSCTKEVRRTSDTQVAGAEEICGTPFLKDQGNGTAKLVPNCKYNIKENKCNYTILEWRPLGAPLVARGSDFNPQWPLVRLAAGQREGDRSETYRVVFLANDKNYTYNPRDVNDFKQFTPNSRWQVKINGLGGITEVNRAQ
jgi:DNA-directed RNA polymerase subunit RPC12/RpoP